MRAYVDSDLIIWHLRGEKKSQVLFKGLVEDGHELWVGAMQRMEVVFFMKSSESTEIRELLSRFKTQAVTQEIVDKGGDFYRKWNPSHGIDVNDALLAASADLTNGRVYTLNVKHYPMPEVIAIKGW